MTTFEKLNNIVTNTTNQNMREGMHVFNVITEHYPEITKKLVNSEVDCYKKDANITVFLLTVAGIIDNDEI